MGLLRDALTAWLAPSVAALMKPLADRVKALEDAIGALQVPADLAQRLGALEARPVIDPVALGAELDSIKGSIAALEAVPVLTEQQAADLGKLREIILDLEAMLAMLKAAPQ